MPDERILIVDDEPAVVSLCTRALAQHGYSVQGTTSGREAIVFLETEPVDLLLVDIVIPDVDGLTVLRRGRELVPDLAAVVITGYATLDSTVEALNAGVHRFVLKPFDTGELIQAVEEALAQKRREQEHLRLRVQLPILEIGQALAAEGQVDHLAGRLLEVVVRQLGADQAALLSLDEAARLTLTEAIGTPAEIIDQIKHSLEQAGIAPALPGESPLVWEEGSPLEPPWPALLRGFAQGTTVLASLHTTKGGRGALLLSRSAGRPPFTPSELGLLAIVSGQIATALENARLYEAVQRELTERKQAEEALRRYADRLEILRQVDQGVLAAQSPRDIAQAALGHIRQLIPCKRASVALHDAATSETVLLTVDTDGETAIKAGTPIPLGRVEDVRKAVRPGQVVIFGDLPARGGILQTYYDEGVRAFVVAPLITQGELVGSLQFGLVDAGTFTKEHEAIACQVADQLAIAIRQARLHEQVQRYAEELEQRVAERTQELEREISERVRVGKELSKSEELYRSLVTNIPDVIWTTDDAGRTTFISPNVETVYGYTPEEIYQGGPALWFERICPDDVELVREAYEALFVEKAIYDVEYRIQHRDGHWIWLHDKAIATYERDGRRYADGVFSDITARKQAEESLQQERDLITAVLDTAGALVFVLDRQGCIVRFNRACEEMTGYSPDEVAGKRVWDFLLIPEEVDPVKAVFEELRAGQFPNEHENYWLAKDGRRRRIAWSNTCLLDAEGEVEYVIAIGIDVEEERKRQREATTLAEMARLVSSTLDLEKVLDRTAQYAKDILEVDYCSVTMYDETGEMLHYVAGKGFSAEAWAYLTSSPFRPTDAFREAVLEARQPMNIEDASSDPRVSPEVLASVELLDIQSILAAPIEVGGRVLGYLSLANRRGQRRRFTVEDADLALAIANQAVMAVENARHYEEEQRRAEQFRLISEVGRRITSILSVNDLLQEIVRLIKDALGYYLVGIALIEGDELVFKTGAGAIWDNVPVFKSPRLKVGREGITGWVAQSGEPLLAPDVSREPRYYPHPLTEEDVRSELAVPLKTKDRVIGVLHVQSDRLNAFDESDRTVLQSLGHQAAIAIENAQLYEQARQAAVLAERQRLARELHDSVTQAMYSATLLAETGRLAAQADDQSTVESCLDRLGQITLQALKEMRLLIYELRPPALEQIGLVGVLQQRLDAVETRAGVEGRLLVEGEIDLDTLQEEALYRIALEALNNALKHAVAGSVTVRLWADEGQVQLEITDNGRGFAPEAVSDAGGMGLTTMQQRAERIGAVLAIQSAAGEGTQVRVTLKRDR